MRFINRLTCVATAIIVREPSLSSAQHKIPQCFSEDQKLEGGNVLPGWQVDIGDLFSRLDRNAEKRH